KRAAAGPPTSSSSMCTSRRRAQFSQGLRSKDAWYMRTDMHATNDSLVIYTIGHSSHSAERFLELLRTHGVRQLADVRTLPQSRRHPQFGQAALADALEAAGIVYRHFPAL